VIQYLSAYMMHQSSSNENIMQFKAIANQEKLQGIHVHLHYIDRLCQTKLIALQLNRPFWQTNLFLWHMFTIKFVTFPIKLVTLKQKIIVHTKIRLTLSISTKTKYSNYYKTLLRYNYRKQLFIITLLLQHLQ